VKSEIEIEGKKIEFEIQNLAERANGEAMVRCGDTQVFVTCVMSPQEIKGLGFFPLSVNYEERYYAAGKILGPRYIKREGKPSDNAVVISRLIDRAIRPLFEKSFQREVQVIITCLSWDEENDPDVLGLLGTSLALSLSDIPWQGPIGVVRVAEKKGKLIINPTYSEREESSLDIVFAGLKKDEEILINMIEANAKEVEEELIVKAVKLAKEAIKNLIEKQENLQKEFGKKKILIEKTEEPEIKKRVEKFLDQKIEKILFGKQEKVSKETGIKQAQELKELKQELIELIEQDFPEKGGLAKELFEKRIKELVHEKVLKEKKRVDGRKLDELREISCQTGLIPRAHGSAFFSRGLTKALSILTLGGPSERQLIEGMEIMTKKRFLHHYNFPPYSTGEVKRLSAPSRREIGHGMLVEKALLPVIPDFDDFPYTIRIVSELLSSNGSTSMASVCASSLALMDAGVPIKAPVAGIAIGLMVSPDGKNYELLTDIQGPEDFYGDMDFKVAGTETGITAIQMDVKVSGIKEEVLIKALQQSKKARLKILALMKKTLPEPRPKLSPFAPKIYKIEIPPEKIGEVIGPKGHTIKRIIEETETTIDIEPTGAVFVTSSKEASAKKALGIIKNITREAKKGENFLGKVKKIVDFGAFLELETGQEGLLHISKIKKPLKIGEKVPVKVISIDELGRINLGLQKTTKKKNYARRRKKW